MKTSTHIFRKYDIYKIVFTISVKDMFLSMCDVKVSLTFTLLNLVLL